MSMFGRTNSAKRHDAAPLYSGLGLRLDNLSVGNHAPCRVPGSRHLLAIVKATRTILTASSSSKMETNGPRHSTQRHPPKPALRAACDRHAVRAGDERLRARTGDLEGSRCPQGSGDPERN